MSTPYSAPKSDLASEKPDNAPSERPVGIWIISIFYGFSAVAGAASTAAVLLGVVPLPPEQAEYFSSLSIVDYLFTGCSLLLGLTAAVSLFRLKISAVKFFFGYAALNLGYTAWSIIQKDYLEVVGNPFAALVGPGILVLVCIYVWRVGKKGVLS